MDTNKIDAGLIDLINERARQLHKLTEQHWNERRGLYLSDSEWIVLSAAYNKGNVPVAGITKKMDISRQATHKLVRKLEEKELLTIGQLQNNKRAKAIQLTDYANKIVEEKKALKQQLEQEIINNVGFDEVNRLKEIMVQDWGIQ